MTGVVVVSSAGCKGGGGGKRSSGGGGGSGEEERRRRAAVLELLLAAVRRSVVACRVERGGAGAAGASWPAEDDDDDAAGVELGEMEIGWPTDVRHVAHVTFDRFHGFLGLPVEFEDEMPCRVPSASASVFGVSAESMQCTYDGKGNSVPTILLHMQERLYAQGGLKAEGIFRINPENDQEEHVRDQLNKGVVPEDIDVHCLASLIKAWFRELPEGVLDGLSPEQVLQCNSEGEFLELVTILRPTQAALLNWAVELMSDVVEEEELNKMNARNIAMVFAPNMTQMSDPLTALMHAVQVMNFLKTLILRTLRERDDAATGEEYTPYSSPASSSPHLDAECCYGSERDMDRSCEMSDMHSQISKSGRHADYLVRYNTCFDSEQEINDHMSEVEEGFLHRLECDLEEDRPLKSAREQSAMNSEVMAMEDIELKAEDKAVEKGLQKEEGLESMA
ncbi:Rho GTPase-activating protein 2 [Dichanthelium oligosanthes]|uniref:Rho GTPase-activating protein 2 n=1 Tax=Dichanthelium oligosanthes TaxID=888268 RepID=A0A1E5VC36_9POAL|nr:Rho GTPase-activating protein 2 [Dichanthelium oligosanthes]